MRKQSGALPLLDGMAIFAAVIDSGSFTAAARALGLSKSAVSKRIAALEDALGTRLIDRTTRRLRLTEAGEEYYEAAARVVHEAEEAALAVAHYQSEPRGLLRVSVPMSFGQRHVVPHIAEFLARHPRLSLQLDLDDRRVDLIGEGYDLAIRIAALPDSTLVARRLAPARRVLCGAPDYFARHGRPRRPEDLRAHNCLGYDYLATRDEWRFAGRGGAVSVRVAGTFRANNGDALLALARAGVGLVLGPTFMACEDLAAGRLETCLDDWNADIDGIFAVYPQRRHVPPKVRVFVDYLAARYGPAPYWEPDAAVRQKGG